MLPFESSTCHMKSGDRFILVTDGVTEAENAMGDFFEDFRLEAAAAKAPTFEGIFSAVTEFCAGNPLNDDCTVVELRYSSLEE
jgi:Serine phosphatase RsbU, regulator of sigma subunit